MRMTATMLATGLLLVAQTSDLKQYDKIGPLSGRRGEAEKIDGQIRDFLWTHWREHRLATVTISHSYVEGSVRAAYFVEPDRQGRWVIVETTELITPPHGRKWNYSCDQIERVEPDRLKRPLVKVSDEESRGGEQYLLHPLCGDDDRLW